MQTNADTNSTPVRAAGSAYREGRYVAGNFPMGPPAVLKESSTKWKLRRDKPEPVNPRRRQLASQRDATPWLLEDHAGTVTHKGHLEGGINPDNYFLLVKDQGGFTAVPLAAWYNFRPPPRRAAMSLEEAEAEMEKKHNSHFGGTGRLSQAIARNEAKGALDAGPDEGGALGADSDEEEKRANRARAASKDPSSTVEGRNQDAATDVNVIKGDKGAEDWDHEANAADDDEDMGEQDDPNNRDASPPPRQTPTNSQDDEGPEEGGNLSKHGREVQRLLKRAGLSESDEDASHEDVKEDTDLMSDDDDEDEMEDLDALAKGMDRGRTALLPKAASAAETTSTTNTGRKRSPTPTSAAVGAAGTKRKAEGSQVAAAKRKRSATPPVSAAGADAKPAMAGAVKAEPTPSPTDSPRPPDLVSLQEMKDFIRSRGGSIPATQLTQQFKSRIVTTQQKEHFKAMVKTGLYFDKAKKSLDLKNEDK
ncbi:hypothetical protein ABBQ38_007658 [Trebouxia sp. C0009 RCD-2024]